MGAKEKRQLIVRNREILENFKNRRRFVTGHTKYHKSNSNKYFYHLFAIVSSLKISNRKN